MTGELLVLSITKSVEMLYRDLSLAYDAGTALDALPLRISNTGHQPAGLQAVLRRLLQEGSEGRLAGERRRGQVRENRHRTVYAGLILHVAIRIAERLRLLASDRERPEVASRRLPRPSIPVRSMRQDRATLRRLVPGCRATSVSRCLAASCRNRPRCPHISSCRRRSSAIASSSVMCVRVVDQSDECQRHSRARGRWTPPRVFP